MYDFAANDKRVRADFHFIGLLSSTGDTTIDA